jgi:hypothetical protein
MAVVAEFKIQSYRSGDKFYTRMVVHNNVFESKPVSLEDASLGRDTYSQLFSVCRKTIGGNRGKKPTAAR